VESSEAIDESFHVIWILLEAADSLFILELGNLLDAILELGFDFLHLLRWDLGSAGAHLFFLSE
jgi:hypothetical protein